MSLVDWVELPVDITTLYELGAYVTLNDFEHSSGS